MHEKDGWASFYSFCCWRNKWDIWAFIVCLGLLSHAHCVSGRWDWRRRRRMLPRRKGICSKRVFSDYLKGLVWTMMMEYNAPCVVVWLWIICRLLHLAFDGWNDRNQQQRFLETSATCAILWRPVCVRMLALWKKKKEWNYALQPFQLSQLSECEKALWCWLLAGLREPLSHCISFLSSRWMGLAFWDDVDQQRITSHARVTSLHDQSY